MPIPRRGTPSATARPRLAVAVPLIAPAGGSAPDSRSPGARSSRRRGGSPSDSPGGDGGSGCRAGFGRLSHRRHRTRRGTASGSGAVVCARLSDREPPLPRPAAARHDRRASPPRPRGCWRPADGSAPARSRSRSPTIRRSRDRHDEVGLRHLLRDTEVYIDRMASPSPSDDPSSPGRGPSRSRRSTAAGASRWTTWSRLAEGLRLASRPSLLRASAGRSTPRSTRPIGVFRWHRRIAGDARKRNRLLAVPLQGRLSR